MPAIDHLECAHCHQISSPESAGANCSLCAGPLFVRYEMKALRQTARREQVALRAASSPTSQGIWRYACVLPDVEPVTLGEGGTPLLRSTRHPNLLIKQEGANPTASVHARGFPLAVAMAKHSGFRHLALAGHGDEGATLAAYAAAAGHRAHLYMPRAASFDHSVEAAAYGARVTLIDGGLTECARALNEAMKPQTEAGAASDRWLDLSTGREPFRLEGAKTLGYELAEQLGWSYPVAILSPGDDITALRALWKAFEEMEQLGWVSGRRPTLYAVRTAERKEASSNDFFETIAIDAQAPLANTLDWARQEGILLSHEGAAGRAAYDQLRTAGALSPADLVVLINPGAGLRHIDELADALHLRRAAKLPTSAKVGGIITPI